MKRDEWIVVPGMHEAIVSGEEYQKVQKIIHSNPAGERNNTPFPLKSLVVCGYCGRKMARWNSKFTRNPRFYCTYGGKYGNITCKDVKSPFECELEKIVLTGIKDIIARTGSEKKFGKSTECENSEKRIALYEFTQYICRGIELMLDEHEDRLFSSQDVWTKEMEDTSVRLIKAVQENGCPFLEKNYGSMRGYNMYWDEFWNLVPEGYPTIVGYDAHYLADLEDEFDV